MLGAERGNMSDIDKKKLMDIVGNISKKARSSGISSFSLYLNSFKNKNFEFEDYFKKTVLAISLSLYQFLKYKTKDLEKIKNKELN